MTCGNCGTVHLDDFIDDLCRYYLQTLTREQLEAVAVELVAEGFDEAAEHVRTIHPVDA